MLLSNCIHPHTHTHTHTHTEKEFFCINISSSSLWEDDASVGADVCLCDDIAGVFLELACDDWGQTKILDLKNKEKTKENKHISYLPYLEVAKRQSLNIQSQ